MSESQQSESRQPSSFLHRHRSGLIWMAVLVFIGWMQWPMIKGSFYKFFNVPAPADGIAWRTDFTAALAESKQTGKPVLLDFSASWCPPCQAMRHDVWPDQQVRQAVKTGYIPVLLDVDAPASQEVARRYDISSVPTIVIVDAEGHVLRQSSYMSAGAMIGFLNPPA